MINGIELTRDTVMYRLNEIDMNYTKKQRGSVGQFVLSHVIAGIFAGTGLASALSVGTVQAAGEVSTVQTTNQLGTPTSYSIDGQTFKWGMGDNQIMQGFTAAGINYQYAGTADRVELVRDDVSNVSSGNPCGVFVERLGASNEILKANYPSDGSDTGNCDMAAMLAGRVVNRGALDLFSNTGANPKNVERVDYLFDRGLLAPLASSALTRSGHVVAEKRGNNPLQIAAVTELDVFGQPAAFGPLVFVDRNGCSGDTICYGITNLRHNYSFFQNNSMAPQGYPSYLRDSTEPVGMAFVSLADLGVGAGQVYYGFSYFADDVDSSIHTLTDVSTFPDDTNDEEIVFGDGPDIYGGVAGYYLGVGLSVATGGIFKDENGDGVKGDNEAGISDIDLSLYQDTNGNGVFDPNDDAPLGPTFNSDTNGAFRIPGLEDGLYFLLLDESDPDLPPALNVAPGSNPAMFVIQGNDADGVNFSFVSDTGPTDGTDAGSDSGASDSGTADTGASDTGGNDAGAVDAGVSDAGTADSGATDSGVSDSGGNDAGAVDAGGSDVGAVDAGSSDVGAVDVGAVDAGSMDAGTVDAGSVDAGGLDAGVADAGVSDGSGVDGGGTDAGSGTTGGSQQDGANATVANPDSASVAQTQGASVEIPVLANDTDASGLGLTIIGTPESTNATIVKLDNGVLEYKPTFGFIGTDTFLYVIEDGAGTQSTGTVAVDVFRFADLDKNGLNDFDECGCDNLTIEVGVEGTALGSTSLFSFLMLTFMIGVRRVFRTRCDAAMGVLK